MKCAVFLLVSVLLAGGARPDKADPDQEKLQGTWTVESTVFDCKEVPAKSLKGREVVFRGKEFTSYIEGKKSNTLKMVLDSSKKPRQIELWREDLDDSVLGIYSLEGNTLKLCYGEPGAERPTAFESKAGNRHFLLVLKRKKP